MRREPPVHSTEMNLLSEDGDAARLFGDRGAVVEVTSAPLQPVVHPLARRASPPADINAVRRLAQAQAIVERHATYSAAGGLIPLPIINIASVTAIILRMVKMLSNLYGIPFEHDRARALVVGLVGGATPTGLATATASTLYFVMPASALIGLAVSSVTAVACTRSIGRIFVEHFERGETLQDFSTRSPTITKDGRVTM
jgi:uncharacterized protein (DUF697 family)